MTPSESDDGSLPLRLARHEAFARMVAEGKEMAVAYREVVSRRGTAVTSHVNGSKLAASAKVAQRIAYLRKAAQNALNRKAGATVLTLADKLEFLARVVKVEGAAVDVEKDGDLVNGVRFDKQGRAMLLLPDKLAAIKLHNDLAGEGSEAKGMSALGGLVARLRK